MQLNDDIAHLVKYRVEQLNSIFVQLQSVQTLECKWYLHKGYNKRSYSFEITNLKVSHICVSTFVKIDHHQFDANFIANAILTLVMNKLSMMVASIQDEIKLHYKYKISYEK